jgi:hypothetical protein
MDLEEESATRFVLVPRTRLRELARHKTAPGAKLVDRLLSSHQLLELKKRGTRREALVQGVDQTFGVLQGSAQKNVHVAADSLTTLPDS